VSGVVWCGVVWTSSFMQNETKQNKTKQKDLRKVNKEELLFFLGSFRETEKEE